MKLLLCLVLVCMSVMLPASPEEEQLEMQEDTAQVQVRVPPQAVVDKYYNNEKWRYGTDKSQVKEEPNLFDRIWNAFWQSIRDAFITPEGRKTVTTAGRVWQILLFLTLITLVVLAVLKLSNTGISGIFSGKRKTREKADVTIEDENIHAIDYIRMIEEARRNKDYRLGVRLWFLRTLKALSDHDWLSWRSDKTNADYYQELAGTKLQAGFDKVSLLYDYVWYGEFPVDANSYEAAEERFRNYYDQIDRKQL
ncbi:MAG TPA: DUF4129 domain-containing protein [Bacteroidia bacterium]|nr:DUF4129 domain-containing protein [Bacteroidia bacterium]